MLINLEKLVDVASGLVLQLKLETAGYRITGNHRWLEHHHCGVFYLLTHCAVKLSEHTCCILSFLTFAPVLELYDKRTVRVALTGDKAVTKNLRTRLDCRIGGKNLVHLGKCGLCFIKRRCRRHVDHTEQHAGVLIRNQSGRRGHHHCGKRHDADCHNAECRDFMIDEESCPFFVADEQFLIIAVESFVECLYKRHFLGAAICLVRFQEHRTQSRRQGQCVQCRQSDGDCHCQTKLAIEHARRS